ncbi:MAG TPA: phospholipase D-like domain-containing protein [Candidatus Saccharimonadia bacterium]|nr:phospholipase D-like domain-containing protein [Candidatus Saccharimonadia bacterium]
MKLRFPHQTDSQDVITSQLFDQDSFYQKFLKDVANCQRELIIECPFMTGRRVGYLLPALEKLAHRGCRIVVNTKHPDEQEDYLRNEAITALSLLKKAGVIVLFTGGHHRKLAILDRQILYEGSLNILSQNDSCEIMRRINSSLMSQQMVEFLGIKRFMPNGEVPML